MIDPMGISNWSVTYVDWSERQWHPKTHTANEISLEFMKNVTVCFETHNLLKVVVMSFLLSSFLACQTEEMSTHVTSVGEVYSLADLSLLWPLYISLFLYTFELVGFEAWR